MPRNKSLQLPLMGPAAVSRSRYAQRVTCATVLGYYKASKQTANRFWLGLLTIALCGYVFTAEVVRADECVAIDSEMEGLLNSFSARTGTKFVIDPRVSAKVNLIGIDTDKLKAKDVDQILFLHGFVAYESDDIVYVMPNNTPDWAQSEFDKRWLQ
ncbi:MAG: hypothetical protein AAGH76_14980 [Pseudomonadota bacterium]